MCGGVGVPCEGVGLNRGHMICSEDLLLLFKDDGGLFDDLLSGREGLCDVGGEAWCVGRNDGAAGSLDALGGGWGRLKGVVS